VVTAVGKVTGDERRARMFLYRPLKRADNLGVTEDAGLVVEPPFQGIHQAVVVAVHRLVHPDRLGDMDADRQTQVSALLQKRIQPRIVDVDSPATATTPQAAALVDQLPHTLGTSAETAFQLGNRS